MQDYMQNAGKSSEELLEEARESALTRLRRTLLIEEIARIEEIEVTDEDVTAETDTMLTAAGPDADRSQVESDEAQSSIRSMLLRRKSVEKLAEIVESKGGTSARTASATSSESADADTPESEEEGADDKSED